jgi:hypothetical protein
LPTVLRIGPYRFFFYSADGDEPVHIHVERAGDEAKFWLDPVRQAESKGFAPSELRQIGRIVDEHREMLLRSWHEYFGN